MARYFFDFQDGASSHRDEDGDELASLEAAKQEAIQAVMQMGRDHIPAGSSKKLIIDVRDESGRAVLSVSLKLEVITHERRARPLGSTHDCQDDLAAEANSKP